MNPTRLCVLLFMATLIAAVCQSSSTAAAAGSADRATINFDRDWRFHLDEVADGQNPELDDSSWRKLDVPHDWSIEEAAQGEQPHLPIVGVVEGKWQFHRGDDPSWKDPELKLDGWEAVQLPAWWNYHSNYDGVNNYGWYRRTIEIPKEYIGKTVLLNLGRIDDCDVTYFNGQRIGATGRMPPRYRSAWENVRLYKVSAQAHQGRQERDRRAGL